MSRGEKSGRALPVGEQWFESVCPVFTMAGTSAALAGGMARAWRVCVSEGVGLKEGRDPSGSHVRKSTLAVYCLREWIGEGQVRGLKASQKALV